MFHSVPMFKATRYLLSDGWMVRGKIWCPLVAQHFQTLLLHAHARSWLFHQLQGSVPAPICAPCIGFCILLFGVIVTDCYYASRYIHSAEMSGVKFREYVNSLAFQLINSDSYGSRSTSALSDENAPHGQAIHILKSLYTLPTYGENLLSQYNLQLLCTTTLQ